MTNENRKAKHWEKFGRLFKSVKIPARTVLLQERQISRTAFYVEKAACEAGLIIMERTSPFSFSSRNRGFLRWKVLRPAK
jgi:hypothetical protein